MDDIKRQVALELIRTQSTLTLATAADNSPWSAPVYYVFLDGYFYFFSSPDSRHIRQALIAGTAAASVFHQGQTWRALRGLQMDGTVQAVESAVVSMRVVAAYLDRFDFVRTFFAGQSTPTPADFFARFKARLYAFMPATVYLTDNRNGIGNRQRVELIR